jgi:UDP-2,3-diacylglucosamine pyrophosphatase LpxH
MKSEKRVLDIVVLSDVHLGSFGCHADELCEYLKSIETKKLILNGDIIDGWVFKKNFFPESHFAVLRKIMKMVKNGTEVYYITGNHDDFLRKFDSFKMLNFSKVDKLVLEIDGKKYWFFHGDVFDIAMTGKIGKFISRIGGKAYELIIFFNRMLNKILNFFGRPSYSLSAKIKESVKKAVIYVNDFEEMSCEHAIKQGYDYVVNGHIHQPSIRTFENEGGKVIYMNSGDYVENLTSLEYSCGVWSIHKFSK